MGFYVRAVVYYIMDTPQYTFLLPAYKSKYFAEALRSIKKIFQLSVTSAEYNMRPLVSVIIPNYCHARYLDQRIQSVLNQTYQNFEVIILDDCSPDDGASMAVIEQFRPNPHVSHIVYNKENSGSTFKQWQNGISLAKGEIIWIAESDDYCSKDFLQKVMECWEWYPDCSIVQTASCRVNSVGEEIFPDCIYSGKRSHAKGRDFIQYNMLCSNFHIPNASAVTFRREYIEMLPNDYMSYKSAGDRLFWIYMLEHGNICTIDAPLNFFRNHESKVSPQKELDGTQCRENYKINRYLHKKGYVTGVLRLVEYTYYWKYINSFHFDTEDTKKDLMKLWFPRWWMGRTTVSIAERLIKWRGMVTTLHIYFNRNVRQWISC